MEKYLQSRKSVMQAEGVYDACACTGDLRMAHDDLKNQHTRPDVLLSLISTNPNHHTYRCKPDDLGDLEPFLFRSRSPFERFFFTHPCAFA